MAKLPKWDAQVDITPSGPAISRNPAAGATGEAMAGVGQQIRRFGAILSAEARQAEEQTRELQRDTEASRHVLEVAKAKDTALAEMSQTAEPTAQQEIWNQFQSGVNDLIDHVDDDKTRQYVELQLNNKMPSWNAVAVGSIQQTRLAQADAVDQAMLDDTVRTRTLQPYVEHLDRRLAAGAETQETYTRKKELAARMVDTGLETDAIRARVKAMPVADAIRELDTMNRPRNLNEQEWGPLRHTLLTELRVEDTAAGLEQQKQLAIVDRTENEFWVKIHTGATTPQEVVSQEKLYAEGKGGIRPEIGHQMLQMMAAKPRDQNDPQAYDDMVDAIADLRAGRIDRDEARKRLVARADQLKPATREQFASEIAATGTIQERTISDASQYARSQIVTAPGENDPGLFQMPEEAQKIAIERRREQFRILEFHDQSLRDYAKKNPDATADDLYVESRKILFRIRQQSEIANQGMVETWEAQQIVGPGRPVLFDAATGRLVIPEGKSPETGVRSPQTQNSGLQTAPKGLEGVWDGLNEQEKLDVLELLRRGWTVERILQEAGQ